MALSTLLQRYSLSSGSSRQKGERNTGRRLPVSDRHPASVKLQHRRFRVIRECVDNAAMKSFLPCCKARPGPSPTARWRTGPEGPGALPRSFRLNPFSRSASASSSVAHSSSLPMQPMHSRPRAERRYAQRPRAPSTGASGAERSQVCHSLPRPVGTGHCLDDRAGSEPKALPCPC